MSRRKRALALPVMSVATITRYETGARVWWHDFSSWPMGMLEGVVLHTDRRRGAGWVRVQGDNGKKYTLPSERLMLIRQPTTPESNQP